MSESLPKSSVSSMTMGRHQLKVMVEPGLAEKVEQMMVRSRNYLLSLQNPDGHWRGELVVDTTLVCDILLYMYWKGEINVERQARIVKHILDRQLEDGGWAIYPGGPSEINASVKCYFALKMAGFSPEDPVMKKAHNVILRLGGIPKMNTYGKLYLALIGQFPWKYLPVIPAEIILLPNWLFFNIYEMSSWTRNMVVPLSIINHFKPVKLLPPEKQLHELYPYGTEGQDFNLPWSKDIFTLRNLFLMGDRILKVLEACPWKPLRARALKKAEEWIIKRNDEKSDGLGAIFPSMLNTLFVLKLLGYPDDHDLVKKCEKHLFEFEVYDEEKDDYRFQPCLSPVWDTAITSVALATAGVPADDPRMVKAADWLLEKEVRVRGDWYIVKNKYEGEPSGWAFEYNNIYYPDVDDTVKVLLALRQLKATDEENRKAAIKRALPWAASFQCKEGGFGAFDKDITQPWLEHIPFADHNAILDPPCSDITAKVLECYGKFGYKNEPFIQKAVQFMKDTQEEDGSWFGRWGVNYVYGTWQGLRGLAAIGFDMNQDWLFRARDWLESCQNPDGGWGETCASYDDPTLKGKGISTASQTAWGMMGIMAFGDPHRPSIQRAAAYLAATQRDDGSWREDVITGTGFPCVFYLKYEMYQNNWPLIGISELNQMLKDHSAKA